MEPEKPTKKKKETTIAITITYGDVAENHIHMQKISAVDIDEGLTVEELGIAKSRFEKLGCNCNLYDLKQLAGKEIPIDDEAAILVVRNGVDLLLDDIEKTKDDMLDEQLLLEWDTTILSVKHKNNGKGGVVNKNARHNLCYSDTSQEPDIVNGRGTIVSFKNIPCTSQIRERLPEFLGEKTRRLVAEGNKYYDTKKTGIGYHGDGERLVVVAVRLGESIPLHYQWYHRFKPVGSNIRLELNHGDIYIMSAKAVGTDWKRSSIYTLRHAAGSSKYTTVKV